MDKIKLVELFERVALPLPQRKYNDKVLGRRMESSRLERNVKAVDYDENTNTRYMCITFMYFVLSR